MRKVVVLPAPLGPSRPVISPSRAAKPTPSTATTGPDLVRKVLCRSWTSIISGLPAVEAGKRWRRRQLLQALDIQCAGVGGFEELRQQPRHATGTQRAVPLPLQHQVARARQLREHLLAVAWRRDRIQCARYQQRRHVAGERRAKALGTLAAWPHRALRQGEVHQL